MSDASEEIKALLAQNAVAGIETVSVHDNQTTLDVIFYQQDNPPQPPAIVGAILKSQVRIYTPDSEDTTDIPVTGVAWTVVGGRDALRVKTSKAGGFNPYKLKIESQLIDSNFNDIAFEYADRLERLMRQNSVAGIDFIYVHQNQVELDVFFYPHDHLPHAPAIVGAVAKDKVRIYSPDGLPDVPVIGTAWLVVDNRDVLRVDTSQPGDFSQYRLKIQSDQIDNHYNDKPFTFKANCKSDLDCRQRSPDCPSETIKDFPIDYRGRDYQNLRTLLLDFASQRYPDWQDRLEADLGVMLVEVMSAMGDEMSYIQDRVAREAYLESATQRRSLRHHARLVDYEIGNGLAASTWLDVTVESGKTSDIPAGADVWAEADDGKRISFEVGRNLADALAGRKFSVRSELNAIPAHLWDEDDGCLPWGSTQLYLEGDLTSSLKLDYPPEKLDCKWALLQTAPSDPGKPARRWLVRIINISLEHDDILNRDLTLIEWDPDQTTPYELCLAELSLHANLVPITAGRTVQNRFVIGEEPENLGLDEEAAAELRQAVERQGADGSVNYLFSLANPALVEADLGEEEAEEFLTALPKPEGSQLTWLENESQFVEPEIQLKEVEYSANAWKEKKDGQNWQWRRVLIGETTSKPEDPHYTLEDGTWDRVVGYWRSGEEVVHRDYRTGEGYTIRFGDGVCGSPPEEKTIFQATYRLGNGRNTNVAAGAVTQFDATALTDIEAVTNPLAADNGADPESATHIRQQAPEAYRYDTYRAVRPEDYSAALEKLAWVQRAGAKLRWTGSWLSIFATPDPLYSWEVTDAQGRDADQQLQRYRQAGREAWTAEPRYADLDLEITVCVQPHAYAGEVKSAVWEALMGKQGPRPKPGFFSPDNFTFGDSLQRPLLENAIHSVPGVRAVKAMRIRRRGWFDWRDFHELAYEVAQDEVVRLENDPLHPKHGILYLKAEGGA